MAPRAATRLRGGRVSYREASPEDDNEEDSSFDSEDLDDFSQPRNRMLATGSPATRRQSTRIPHKLKDSLKEPSSDEEFSEALSGDGLEEVAVAEPTPKRRRIARNPDEGMSTIRKAVATRRRNVPSQPSRPQRAAKLESKRSWSAIETDGVCPPWTTLPYEILVSVFTYALAKYPTDTKAGSAWILGATRTCRAFAEPALTALYWCPPIQDARQLQTLFDLLTRPSERYLLKYHSKIKRIELDERILPTRFELGRLITSTPQLAHLDIWSGKDYRLRGHPQISGERWWKFPETFAEELEAAKPPLRSFHWNQKMLLSDVHRNLDHRVLRHILERLPMSRLNEITFTNFYIQFFTPINYSELRKEHPEEAGLEKHPRCLAAIILRLPLRKVRYEYSRMGWDLMPEILPKNLQALELHCCDEVKSEDLQSYLLSHGGTLRKLVLDHNATLDLEFLPCLKGACPKLEELTMNLIYHNMDRASDVIQPTYEELIHENTTPSWPSSLVKIELLHLRRWSSESAIVFFNSLIDSATSLQNLRYLVLSASIEMGWQHRAGFRDQWVSKFEEVFLRKSTTTSPHLVSLKAFRKWKEAQSGQRSGDPRNMTVTKDISSTQSLSSGIGGLRPRRAIKSSSLEDFSNSLQSSLKDSVLQALRNKAQKMCNVVDIRIDNSRPMEREYRESDMLDSEESGDEDYV